MTPLKKKIEAKMYQAERGCCWYVQYLFSCDRLLDVRGCPSEANESRFGDFSELLEDAL